MNKELCLNIFERYVNWFCENDIDLWITALIMNVFALIIQGTSIEFIKLISNDSNPDLNIAMVIWSIGWIVLFRYYLKKERNSHS